MSHDDGERENCLKIILRSCVVNRAPVGLRTDLSGVTTRGDVRQLPHGAKRQGALGGAFGRRIVCFALENSAEFLKRERS